MPLRPIRAHLGALTAELAARHPNRPAITDDAPTPGLHDGGTRTYADLEDAVSRLAAVLSMVGVPADDPVLVAVDNRVDTVLWALALARVGALPAPCNPRLTAAEGRAVLRATGAGVVVGDRDVVGRLGLDEVADVRRLDTAELGAKASVAARPGLAPDRRRDPDEVALLLTTSGTTGTPKAAALTSSGLLGTGGLLAMLPLGRSSWPRAGRDRVLAALPFAHVMGLSVALSSWCAGVELVHRPRFDPHDLLDAIEEHRPNVVVGVPTMYADLEAAGVDDRDLTSVQVFGSAADAMPDARARRFQRRGATARVAGRTLLPATFVDVYGMVELSGAAAVRVFAPSPVALPAPALLSPALDVRVVDDDGRPAAYGEVGELQVRGGGVLSGYLGRPEAGPDDHGWFATGDRVRRFPGNVVAFAGRERDRLKVGGFSVFPAEVETSLAELPHVAEVALVGLPDERLGDRPVALVVPAGPAFDAAAFLAAAREAVAGYRRPHEVVVVDHLPRGNNGKLDRAAATALGQLAGDGGDPVGT